MVHCSRVTSADVEVCMPWVYTDICLCRHGKCTLDEYQIWELIFPFFLLVCICYFSLPIFKYLTKWACFQRTEHVSSFSCFQLVLGIAHLQFESLEVWLPVGFLSNAYIGDHELKTWGNWFLIRLNMGAKMRLCYANILWKARITVWRIFVLCKVDSS